MNTVKILLSDINSVRKFVDTSCKYDFPINLVNEKYIINAKSIIGVLSLDLSEPLTVKIKSKNDKAFLKEIETFIVQ